MNWEVEGALLKLMGNRLPFGLAGERSEINKALMSLDFIRKRAQRTKRAPHVLQRKGAVSARTETYDVHVFVISSER